MFQYQPTIPGNLNQTLKNMVNCSIKEAANKLVPPNYLCFTHKVRDRRLASYGNYACLRSKDSYKFRLFRSKSLVISMRLPKISTVAFSIIERKTEVVRLSKTYENISGVFAFLPFLEGDVAVRTRINIQITITTRDEVYVFVGKFHTPGDPIEDYIGSDFVDILCLQKSESPLPNNDIGGYPLSSDENGYYGNSACFDMIDSPITQEQYDCYTCYRLLNPGQL
jgi:hypothetical protein